MKDPAFLFYSKDWIEGTAELLPNEKGVYIDLLCYQHQRGDLPNDTKRLARMMGMSVDEFEQIWKTLSSKFEANGERTLNRKLSEVMGARKEKGKTNKIIGIFGSLCRAASETKENLNTIRSQFKVSDFTEIPESEVSERLTEWFNNRLASLGNANGNANKDGNGKGTGKPRKDSSKQKIDIPSLDEFISYGKDKKGAMNISDDSFRLKYLSWLENGWRTGGEKPRKIDNWKTSLLNTMKYMQSESNRNSGSSLHEISSVSDEDYPDGLM